ncbi:MAG: hypothetical protein M1120_01460 [Patescibacteria group bacterium]|nr:hypothetical protein [Patescibacteria group bacterium]
MGNGKERICLPGKCLAYGEKGCQTDINIHSLLNRRFTPGEDSSRLEGTCTINGSTVIQGSRCRVDDNAYLLFSEVATLL